MRFFDYPPGLLLTLTKDYEGYKAGQTIRVNASNGEYYQFTVIPITIPPEHILIARDEVDALLNEPRNTIEYWVEIYEIDQSEMTAKDLHHKWLDLGFYKHYRQK